MITSPSIPLEKNWGIFFLIPLLERNSQKYKLKNSITPDPKSIKNFKREKPYLANWVFMAKLVPLA
jgi:hypothetical protein